MNFRNTNQKFKVVLSVGDESGIGPEIILTALYSNDIPKNINFKLSNSEYNKYIRRSMRAYTDGELYGKKNISERHRHRYEVNINYREEFENKGMIFSGLSPDYKLPEIIELKDHPWFIGVQFHPEFKSRPLAPHPLFSSFIKAAKKSSKK